MTDQQEFQQLYHMLNQLHPLSRKQLKLAMPFFQPMRLKKKEYFLRIGETADREAFIVSGLVRLFYLNSKGKEVNRGFALENHFCGGSAAGAFSGEPAVFSIQALEPSTLLVFNLKDFKNTTYFKQIEPLILKQVLSYREKREKLLLLESAEARYRYFIQDKKILSKRLPQIQIAAYLGIDPATLSRLKKKLEKSNFS